MKKEVSEKELFETMPVPRAVATLAIPTIISQVVTMIYNLGIRFLWGRSGILIWLRQYPWFLPGSTCSPRWETCSVWAAEA